MPVTTHKNTKVVAKNGSTFYIVPSLSTSISTQNKLESSRFLAPNQNNNFRIGGELACKISLSFVACNQIGPSSYSFNFASGVLNDLTGVSYLDHITIGGRDFSGCYLESASMDITPFAPVTLSAEFSCLNPPIGESFIGDSNSYSNDLISGIAYGYNTTITNGTLLSDSNRDAISYKVNCDRSYTTSIGNSRPDNSFLNGVQKELNIKSKNIGTFINYSGYGDSINIDVKNASGQSIITNGIGMSTNSRITSQNLSISEGDILAGDITLSEVVL